MHTHQSHDADNPTLPAHTAWKIRVPHIGHISRSVDAIPKALSLLDQTLTEELTSCEHSLSRVAPNLSMQVSPERSTTSCLYNSAHINVFNRTILKPLLERIEPLITSPVDSNQLDRCIASLYAVGRYRELLRTRAILQNRGGLVFLRAIAERAWNLHEECLHMDHSQNGSCNIQNFLRQGASTVYSYNNDWFSRDIFEPLAAKAVRFLPFTPRTLRSSLFQQDLHENLDKALRYESAIGVRGALSGDSFDARLAVLRKLVGASQATHMPVVVCADGYSQTMVEAYLQSLTPHHTATVASTLDKVQSLCDKNLAHTEKQDIYFVGIGPVTKHALLYLQEKARIDRHASATFLFFSGSSDEMHFQKSLVPLIACP
jgi:hypothetical protein